eukprot:2931529-Karenia_brevis.AAC.1
MRSDLSKKIQSSIRTSMRKHKREKIQERLHEFRNLKSISGIRSNGQHRLLQSVVDKNGNVQEDRQQIVDVFADFYTDLYSSSNSGSVEEDGQGQSSRR